MKKKLLLFVSVCLLAAALLSTAAFASVDANQYILITTVSMVALDNGVVEADCTVTATHDYPDVGINWIDFYEEGNPRPVASYSYGGKDDPDPLNLMGHDTASHTVGITYKGTPGHRYYVKVGFYAGTYGVAGGAYSMTSSSTTARK